MNKHGIRGQGSFKLCNGCLLLTTLRRHRTSAKCLIQSRGNVGVTINQMADLKTELQDSLQLVDGPRSHKIGESF